MNTFHRRQFLQSLAASTTLLLPLASKAQGDWPNKNVRIVVPVGGGGILDLLARNLGEALNKRLNVPFVTELRPGADHMIGTHAVARAAGDGYTWLCASVPFTTTVHLRKEPGFHPFNDFKSVALLATSPNVLVVPTALPAHSIDDLKKLGKEKRGGLSYANPGHGSSNHLGAEQLRIATGIEMVGAVYKGQGPAVADLLSGRLDLMVMGSSLAVQYIEAGRLRPIATVAPSRLAALPNVPTMKEVGLDTVNVVPWFGIQVPAATPDALVQRMHAEIRAVAATPEYAEGIRRIGVMPAPDHSIAEFSAMLRAEFNQWPVMFERIDMPKT